MAMVTTIRSSILFIILGTVRITVRTMVMEVGVVMTRTVGDIEMGIGMEEMTMGIMVVDHTVVALEVVVKTPLLEVLALQEVAR
jgi:hypothetical protein